MNRKKIAVLTATRAEYGLLKPVVSSLSKEKEFDVFFLVTGAHLSADFGYTYREIEADGLKIGVKIDILTDADTARAVSESMALAISGFAAYFEQSKPDALLVLGDRYETLAVCCAAMNARVPIMHLHGGETTQGAIDEAVRHAVTKMSLLHFTSNEMHRRRVIQLGENPSRVFNVGAVGVENALKMPLLSKQELEKEIGFDLGDAYGVLTYHPVTLETGSAAEGIGEVLTALERRSDMRFIITKANADAGGRTINERIDAYAQTHPNVAVFQSMGALKYLSALKHCAMVIGNSSSGIIEAPSFHVPTINIGDRQKGRMQAESVINCACRTADILAAMDEACSDVFRNMLKNTTNPYGDGNTTNKIVTVIKNIFEKGPLSLKKEFYDIDFDI